MGDRCLIVVTDGQEIAPAAIYTHWSGREAPAIIAEAGAENLLRSGDVSYATARLVGHFHSREPGAMSLGLVAAPDDLEPETLREFSHGDAGVIVVNVSDGTIRYAGNGYHQRKQDAGGAADLPKSVKLFDR